MLGCSVLLGCFCKFVLRCKKFFRIGPWQLTFVPAIKANTAGIQILEESGIQMIESWRDCRMDRYSDHH